MSLYNKNKELEIGGISFGATSGVITTLGIIIGLGTATNSKLATATSIIVLAVCDSLSDALGMQISEESRVDEKNKPVFWASLFTFMGKLFFSGIFLVQILLFELDRAEVISIVLGMTVITVFSIFIAKRRKISTWKEILENVLLAVIVLIASFYIGKLADKM